MGDPEREEAGSSEAQMLDGSLNQRGSLESLQREDAMVVGFRGCNGRCEWVGEMGLDLLTQS